MEKKSNDFNWNFTELKSIKSTNGQKKVQKVQNKVQVPNKVQIKYKKYIKYSLANLLKIRYHIYNRKKKLKDATSRLTERRSLKMQYHV